jgi:glycosyltransferase involved in cell wall biosynthesis
MAASMSGPVLISVVMPVYNCEKFVAEAIESILDQTFNSFEFIIINDHSTDHTPEILESYHDPRIQIYQNPSNLGLTRSLNIGLAQCNGKYTARMDSDDISHPSRFARQVNYLEKHPGTGVLGADYERITSDGIHTGNICSHRSDWELVHWMLSFENPISHPTVCLRTDLIRQVGGYNEDFRYTQDYDLWGRLAKCTHMENLPETLLYYRSGDENQISTTNLHSQKKYELKIRQEIISQLTGHTYPLEIIKTLTFPPPDLDPKIKYEACLAILKISFSYLRVTRGLKKDKVLSIRKDSSKRITTIAKSMPEGRKKSFILFTNNFLNKYMNLYAFF